MRTNIVINEELMTKAMVISKKKTKREVVDVALQEYVENNSRPNLMDLFGKIKFADGYDYKEARGIIVDIN